MHASERKQRSKQMEKSYDELSKIGKKGIRKFAGLSVNSMRKYSECFRKRTGKNPNNVHLKEEFFSFVAKNKIKGSCK